MFNKYPIIDLRTAREQQFRRPVTKPCPLPGDSRFLESVIKNFEKDHIDFAVVAEGSGVAIYRK
jgi:hypothetical protein